MAFQVSPGVEVKEIDLTNVIPAVSTSIGAFAGHFSWGPVGEVGTVSSEKELISVYGTPLDTTNGGQYDNYTSFLQAASFLKYTSTLRVSRAISSSSRNAAGSRYGRSTEVVYIPNKDSFDSTTDFGTDDVGVVQARYPGTIGNSLKAYIASGVLQPTSAGSVGEFSLSSLNDLVNGVAGTTTWASSNVSASANDEIHVAVVDEDGLFTGVAGTVLEVFEGLSLYSDARKDGGSNYYKTVINRDSAYIYINETGFRESFRSSVDGATYAVPGSLGTSGDVFSADALVADGGIASVSASSITNYASPSDAQAGTYYFTSEDAGVTNSGSGVGARFKVVVAGTGGDLSSAAPTVTVLDKGFGFAADDTLTIDETLFGADSPGSVTPDESFTITIEGVDGYNLFDYEFHNGTDGSDATDAADKADVVTALGFFDNPEEIDVNLLFAEVDTDNTSLIANEVISICGTSRKDCVGFISPAIEAASAADVTGDLSYNSSYVVLDSSAVYVYNKYNDSYRYIPANGHIAGLCARTDDTNDPWFSPAGYNRGNLLGVTKLKWNPNKTDRDTLYKAGINPIIAEPGQGILLFGDKTAQSKPSAFDRINVRRLFIVLEKAIATASKYQLFELNDEFTRAMFRNMTEPFLRDVKGRRGITDFLVVCDETNNTGDVIDANRFVADIYIKPARSINFITLNFIATRTGVEFSEVVGTGN